MVDWPDGVGRVVLDEVDSTNAEAARRAAEGERGPLWIMARRQTTGRGRLGRTWDMPEGNLAATYIFAPDCIASEAALYSFTASLAVNRVVLGAGVQLEGGTLKWPNDIIIGHRKVSGILLESSSRTDGVDWLAIGIGINLVTSPPASAMRAGGLPPTDLVTEGGRALSQDDALLHLASSLEWLLAIHREEGFEDAIRGMWLAQAKRLNQEIEVTTPKQSLRGLFRGIDANGQLVLEAFDDGARHHFAAADIHFPD
ncbi:MAG: biotin--[acetyl-CoA-carboxylase] ligase [Pseudomonadota bacterium]